MHNIHIGVNHGGMGCIPQNLWTHMGDDYITIPQYGWLTGRLTRLQHAFF